MGRYCCGIYEHRPEMCRQYPVLGSYVPPTCTYYFVNGERRGECSPDCNSSCCFLPRQGGEPGGAPLPEAAGGESCRWLVYVDRHPASAAEVPSDRKAGPATGGDRENDRPDPDALELVLAEKRRSEGGGAGTP